MDFDKQKVTYLKNLKNTAPDRSKIGTVDEAIKPLLDAINAHENYYTTSSCAGRIDLFVEPESGKKHEADWLFVSHDKTTKEEILAALRELPEETLWFRMEGAILHVCCRDLDAADHFLKDCKAIGWKHSGITGTSPRIMVEAITSERIDVPIAKDNELFVDLKFLAYLVKEANKKLKKTRVKISRLEKAYHM
ncbi:hypothetical protein GOV07_01225 [Candidatus Woesearchaeota archaeon]|nr:hypothetical protein [Candidatus Woesearchaeota archaeon]